jgi:predicted TIM-barrel fold metal-dependent hydrolase
MNYIDAHIHVWTADTTRYALAAGYRKEDMAPPFTPEELFRHARLAGVRRGHLIQMSFYGYANSFTIQLNDEVHLPGPLVRR